MKPSFELWSVTATVYRPAFNFATCAPLNVRLRAPDGLTDAVRTPRLGTVAFDFRPETELLVPVIRWPEPAFDCVEAVPTVEDEPDVRTMVVRLLGTLGEVTQAKNGVEALAHLKAGGGADLIVTDVMMPQMDGLTLSRELKKDPALARIPILMLTAKSSPTSMIDGINAGARQYLTKPFKADDLLAKAKKALAR